MKNFLILLAATVIFLGTQSLFGDPSGLTSARERASDGGDRGEWEEEGFGHCCVPDGSCYDCSWYEWNDCQDNCEMKDGVWVSDLSCADDPCEPFPLGACCISDGTCEMLSQYDCGWSGYGNWKEGTDCGDVECAAPCPVSNMFELTAHPLIVEACVSLGSNPQVLDYMVPLDNTDLDGDGAVEALLQHASWSRDVGNEYDCCGDGPESWDSFSDYTMTIARSGEAPGTVSIISVLDLSPDSIVYEGIKLPDEPPAGSYYTQRVEQRGVFDVTGDGLADAILEVTLTMDDGNEFEAWQGYFYIENISSPPGAACASDIDNNGTVNVQDLITLIGDWGPCQDG